ncbi:sugar ABC transporter ATP-binding protein [Treponema sp.]
MGTCLLKMDRISKAFPGVNALDNVNIEINTSEVLAIVGENGAGKSTLMKILSGIYKRDSGSIILEGKSVEIQSPLHAKQLGISTIHQELNVMENLSVAENIFSGNELIKNKYFVDLSLQNKKTKDLLNTVGLNIDPRTLMKDLSIASRQMVEIAKSLSIKAKIIIMDEPTSSLTETETKKLFQIIKEVCKKGIGIIYISHRLEEVFELSQRVTVLRDGKTVGSKNTDLCTRELLVTMMVGRELSNIYPKTKGIIGEEALRVENISTSKLLNNINFSVRKGEVVGFSGLVGAGRTELAKVIFGLDKKTSGDIYLNGKHTNIRSSWEAIRNGIGFVPEDRKCEGLILGLTVKDNISLSVLNKLKKYLLINNQLEDNLADQSIEKLNIKTPSSLQTVKNLSGGNQQKVVLAKWLATVPNVLILDEPTRGVDVGAKKEIHVIIDNLAKTGMAIIVISSELPEVLGICDRVIVMRNGEIKGEFKREEATQVKVLQLAIH